MLLDTNILAHPDHAQHPVAAAAVEALCVRRDDLCIVPQVLYEFWVICTRPIGLNGLGLGVAAARSEVAAVRMFCTILRDERAILQRWDRLVAAYDVKGKAAHDARLVAAMLRHGLTHILTFNAADFRRYTEIEVVTPNSIVGAAGDR